MNLEDNIPALHLNFSFGSEICRRQQPLSKPRNSAVVKVAAFHQVALLYSAAAKGKTVSEDNPQQKTSEIADVGKQANRISPIGLVGKGRIQNVDLSGAWPSCRVGQKGMIIFALLSFPFAASFSVSVLQSNHLTYANFFSRLQTTDHSYLGSRVVFGRV